MANLAESLLVGPTWTYSPSFPEVSTNKKKPTMTVENLILMLPDRQYREDVLSLLNEKRRTSSDMAVQLWNSSHAVFILLQEVLSLYKMLPPAQFTKRDSTRVCHALALLQTMAIHRDTRMGFINAKIIVYLYPFVKTTGEETPLNNVRLTSLGVIGSLAKVEDEYTPQVVHLLLETEIFPLCLGCMEWGNEMTQTIATLIVSKILKQQEGQNYCSAFAERFFAVGCLLAVMVEKLSAEPMKELLRHILSCYLSLSEMSRSVGASDALSRCFPPRLRDPTYIHAVCDDPSIWKMANELLYNVKISDRWSRQEPVKELLLGSFVR